MTIASISGPSLSGKSTLLSLLKSSLSDYNNILYFNDIHDTVWNDLVDSHIFHEFSEITKDRDYLFIYIARLVEEYKMRVSTHYSEDSLVIMDGSYIDLLIYSMLNMWYHYPVVELQEKLVNDLLELKDTVDIIYMTYPDDENFKGSHSLRVKMSSYKRKRSTELRFYDMFRDNKKVVNLPSSSVCGCDFFIMEDLKSRGLLI